MSGMRPSMGVLSLGCSIASVGFLYVAALVTYLFLYGGARLAKRLRDRFLAAP